MNPPESVSFVLPVRNVQRLVATRVKKTLAAMVELSRGVFEIVVVDDGSQDATVSIVQELEFDEPRIRLLRHSRPRGIEVAGQTGLERARGELVFIQETMNDLRMADFARLYELSDDPSVVAAHAESRQRPIASSLVRRLQSWGTSAKHSLLRVDRAGEHATGASRLQMIRRPHLKKLKSPQGDRFRLTSETINDAAGSSFTRSVPRPNVLPAKLPASSSLK